MAKFKLLEVVRKMLIPIGKISKELGIETHQLREWEKREWLGDVLKDPDSNNQRVYTEEQVERIHLINETIKNQRKKGIKRTDFGEVEEKLLDRFGGEVIKRETEMMIHPNSMDQIVRIIELQNKKIMELTEIIENQAKFNLTEPADYSKDLEEMKKELKFSEQREEKLIRLIEKLQIDVEELKKTPQKSRWKFWGH